MIPHVPPPPQQEIPPIPPHHDFGAKLDWLRLDDGKSSRFQFAAEFDGYDDENWPAINDWMLKHMKRLHKACDGHLRDLGRQLRQQG